MKTQFDMTNSKQYWRSPWFIFIEALYIGYSFLVSPFVSSNDTSLYFYMFDLGLSPKPNFTIFESHGPSRDIIPIYDGFGRNRDRARHNI